MSSKIVKIGEKILKIIFPPLCFNCGKYSENFLCPDCFSKIEFNKFIFCSHCFNRLPDINCRHKNFPILAAASSYHNSIVHNLIINLKYQKFKKTAIPLASIINHYLKEIKLITYLKENNFIIVPLPLHPRKKRERGFNQSELIAEELSKKTNLKIETNIIKRIKNTKPQVELREKKERENNVKDCFQVNPSFNKNLIPKKILLLDDVFTTGATMNEAAKILKNNKVKEIIYLVVAKA